MVTRKNENEYSRAIIYRRLLQRRNVLKTAIDVMLLSHIIDRAVQKCGFKLNGGFMMEDVTTINDAELDTMLVLNNGWLPYELNHSKASRVMGVSRMSIFRSLERLEKCGLIKNGKVEADYEVLHGGFFELVEEELPCELRIVYSWLNSWCEYNRTKENVMRKETLAEVWGCTLNETSKYLCRLERLGLIEKLSSCKTEYHGFIVK